MKPTVIAGTYGTSLTPRIIAMTAMTPPAKAV
jgi:hypothetical protein